MRKNITYGKPTEKKKGNRIVPPTQMKTCTSCGLTKSPKDFSGRKSVCNVCNKNKYITCGNPECDRKRKPEKSFEIYDVVNDVYTCNQNCSNEKWGVVAV